MPNPDLIPVPFAQDGQKNTIQLDRIVSDPAYRATWAEGFPADTRIPKEVGGEGPDGLDFNGILNALSQAVVFLQRGNAYQFDESLAPYPIGALVRSNDNLTTYQSTIAGNSNNPNSNMTGWRVYSGSGFIADNLTTDDSTRALSARQGKALQDNKLEKTDLKDASTTQKGVVQLNNTLTSTSTVQALTAAQGRILNLQSFGVGQSWQNVTGSRASGVTYTNNTGKPIQVVISVFSTNNPESNVLNVGGVTLLDGDLGTGGMVSIQSFVVPVGASYSFTTTTQIRSWSELR